MAWTKVCFAACAATMVAGCGLIRDQADPNTVSVRGVQPTLEQLNVSGYSRLQNDLVDDLRTKAGFALPLLPGDPNWTIVFDQGVYEVSRQCDQYLDALFRFNREQRAMRQGLIGAAATTGVILGLSGVTTTAMAIVAAAFGLSATLFDAGVNSVLFTIEPSALRNIVLKGRQSYLELVREKVVINSRPSMMNALQGYLTQCSPAAIEANINNAANGTDSVASNDRATRQRAAGLAAPSLVTASRVQTIVTSPVVIAPTGPPPGAPAAGRLLPEEDHITVSMLQSAQQKLGVAIDGAFGPDTREALLEFQKGMNRARPDTWPASEVTRLLAGKTLAGLATMKAPPAEFRTPFERALLGSDGEFLTGDPLGTVDPGRLEFVLEFIGVPTDKIAAVPSQDARLKLMRERIKELRKSFALPAADVIDSALYDKVWETSPLNPNRKS